MSIREGGARARSLARAGLLAIAALPCLPACMQEMYDQPRYDPLEESKFFTDGLSARQPPKGTVPRGDVRGDQAFYSGLDAAGGFVATPPMPVGRELLLRGQERYGIYCSPCHSLVGDGNGMIVLRGYKRPASYHIDRLRNQPIGYFVDVMVNGFGVMPSYAFLVPADDRWAIAVYIRALQLSQSARLSELLPEDAARIEGMQ